MKKLIVLVGLFGFMVVARVEAVIEAVVGEHEVAGQLAELRLSDDKRSSLERAAQAALGKRRSGDMSAASAPAKAGAASPLSVSFSDLDALTDDARSRAATPESTAAASLDSLLPSAQDQLKALDQSHVGTPERSPSVSLVAKKEAAVALEYRDFKQGLDKAYGADYNIPPTELFQKVTQLSAAASGEFADELFGKHPGNLFEQKFNFFVGWAHDHQGALTDIALADYTHQLTDAYKQYQSRPGLLKEHAAALDITFEKDDSGAVVPFFSQPDPIIAGPHWQALLVLAKSAATAAQEGAALSDEARAAMQPASFATLQKFYRGWVDEIPEYAADSLDPVPEGLQQAARDIRRGTKAGSLLGRLGMTSGVIKYSLGRDQSTSWTPLRDKVANISTATGKATPLAERDIQGVVDTLLAGLAKAPGSDALREALAATQKGTDIKAQQKAQDALQNSITVRAINRLTRAQVAWMRNLEQARRQLPLDAAKVQDLEIKVRNASRVLEYFARVYPDSATSPLCDYAKLLQARTYEPENRAAVVVDVLASTLSGMNNAIAKQVGKIQDVVRSRRTLVAL